MKMSVPSLLICQNDTKFVYTNIIDTNYKIRSGEYIHATLEQSVAKTNSYEIDVLFGRSFKKDMTRRQMSTAHSPTILTLRMSYADAEPGATEIDLNQGLWGDFNTITQPRSVNRIFHESSYGQFQFQQNGSFVATVFINESITGSSNNIGTQCSISTILQQGNQAATEANIDTQAFSNIEYIIPTELATRCGLTDMTSEGCAIPGVPISECITIAHISSVSSRSRLFGSHFGLMDATGCGLTEGECTSPYAHGDASAIMGGAGHVDHTGGFIAPNRISMDWIGDITDSPGDGRLVVRALAIWPSRNNASSAAIRFPCACPSGPYYIGDACSMIISYRTPTGIDSHMMNALWNTVYIHITSESGPSETVLHNTLRLGDSYRLDTGKVIVVCNTQLTNALVYIGDDISIFDACPHAPATNILAPVIIGVIVIIAALILLAKAFTRVCRIREPGTKYIK